MEHEDGDERSDSGLVFFYVEQEMPEFRGSSATEVDTTGTYIILNIMTSVVKIGVVQRIA